DADALKAYLKASQLDPQWTYPLVNAAIKYMRRGELAAAQQCALNAVNISVSDAEAHAILGSIYASLGNTDEAVREYQLVVQLRPNSSADYIALGRLLMEQGNYPSAEVVLSNAVQLNPIDARAQLYLSIATQKRAQVVFQLALDQVQEASARTIDDMQLHIALGDAAGEAGNRAGMIDEYRA